MNPHNDNPGRRNRTVPSELFDVRPVDPFADAVAGLCCFVLIGGLTVCVIGAIWRWLAEVIG